MMRKQIMKKTAMLLTAALLLSSSAGCGSSGASGTTAPGTTPAGTAATGDTTAASGSSGETVTATFCNMLATDHPQSVAAVEVLAKEISEKTGGKFTIDVQVNGALGSDAETTEATIMGNMNMTGPACATLATIDSNWYILDVPYVFMSKEQARTALDGDLGQYLSDSLEASCGLICLGYGESGMRQLSTGSKKVTTPADLSGLKIRVLENKYHLATFEALGANPTPMAFSEVYTALQMNQVDGQDNPITITCTNKFYEVQKYYTLTEHLFCGNCVVVNAEWFRSLPEDYQKALRESVDDMITEQRRLIDENEAAYLEEMKAKGCEVVTLTDEEKQAFADATQTVRDDFAAEFGEAGQTMLDMAAKYAQ